MPSGFLHRLRRTALALDGGGLSDGQLLSCFIERRDEAAFEALVRRHGPMVLGVCRRVLGNHHDAEDAFQATFLVLARKAASLRARELVGNWLYGAAYRTAREARATLSRRRARERQVGDMPDTQAEPDPVWRELRPLLDRELDRLPEKYRAAVVLCDLEGRTRRDVARQLRVPEGTVSSRLATARKMLARRLARYGLALSGGALAAALSGKAASACVTAALATSTAQAAVVVAAGQALAAGAVPARVLALNEGVIKTMFLTKLRTFVAVAVVAFVSAGVVGLAYRTTAAEPARAAGGATAPGQEVPDDLEALRLEVEALRKGLLATRDRVKALEGEVQALKAVPRAAGAGGELPGGDSSQLSSTAESSSTAEFVPAVGQQNSVKLTTPATEKAQPATSRPAGAADPLAEAEAALKKLRVNPDDRQAADTLEQALKRLRERAKPEGAAKNKPGKQG